MMDKNRKDSKNMHLLMPFYSQKKEPWKSCSYHKYLIDTDGCAPVAFAMAASYLLEKEVTPEEIAAWTGLRFAGFRGRGTKPVFFSAVAKAYGLKCTGTKRIDDVIKALQQDNPVIYYTCGSGGTVAMLIESMIPRNLYQKLVKKCKRNKEESVFSKITHYLVLSGIDENGNIWIHNPNGMNDGMSFSPAIVERFKMKRLFKDSYYILEK